MARTEFPGPSRQPRAGARRWLVTAFALILAVLSAALAGAHDLGSVQVTTTFHPDATYQVDVTVDPSHLQLADGPARSLGPVASGALDAFDAGDRAKIETFLAEFLAGAELRFDEHVVRPRLTVVAGSNLATARLEGDIPPAVSTFRWSAAMPVGVYLLTLRHAGEDDAVRQWLVGGAPAEPFALDAAVVPLSTGAAIRLYLSLGFTHIVPKGLDHILFVLGIFLLSQRLRPVIAQVTAFTVAHTLTLGLSIYGLVSLPAAVVEPLIALSIVYVAIENVVTTRLSPWRVTVVFGFGLLHGLGFAGVLREIGLPRAQFLNALLAFNGGVELGQLAVILLAFAVVGLAWRRREWYRRRIVIPASLAIALVGLYWAIERVDLAGGPDARAHSDVRPQPDPEPPLVGKRPRLYVEPDADRSHDFDPPRNPVPDPAAG